MTKRLKRKQKKLGIEPTPGLIAAIALGYDLTGELGVDLSEAEAEKQLEALWPKHRVAAEASWAERFGAGTRCPQFWKLAAPAPGRPYVRPSNGTGEDSVRYAQERKVADIRFLMQHGLLSKKEEAAIIVEAQEAKELCADYVKEGAR